MPDTPHGRAKARVGSSGWSGRPSIQASHDRGPNPFGSLYDSLLRRPVRFLSPSAGRDWAIFFYEVVPGLLRRDGRDSTFVCSEIGSETRKKPLSWIVDLLSRLADWQPCCLSFPRCATSGLPLHCGDALHRPCSNDANRRCLCRARFCNINRMGKIPHCIH